MACKMLNNKLAATDKEFAAKSFLGEKKKVAFV